MRIIMRQEKEFPEKLIKVKSKINKIYIEGDLENLNKFGIAIIGSRNSSKDGEKITKEFTKKLVEKGITIISGMAIRNRYNSTRNLYRKRRKNNSSSWKWIK